MVVTAEPTGISLAGNRSTSIELPFGVAQFDHIMKDGSFEALNASFPPSDSRWYKAQGLDSKISIDSSHAAFDAVAGASQTWLQFLKGLKTFGFWNMVATTIYPIMRRNREAGLLASQWPANVRAAIDQPDGFAQFIRHSTKPYFELSYLYPGDMNSPHSDDWKKLVSMIVYFPPENWRADYGGGTVFLQAKTDLASRPWYKETMNRVPVADSKAFFADMEPFFRAEYQRNSCVVFCKTNNSFHAVEPIKCPPGLARRAFVLGLKLLDA